MTRCTLLLFILLTTTANSFSVPGSYNILDYGAKGDGSTLNTRSIQAAIDACSGGGGGMVSVPPGKFITGTLRLRSNITLDLEAGAILTGSKNLDDYPVIIPGIRSYTDSYTNKSLIYGEGLENISITGLGTLDGNGASFKVSDELRKKDLSASYKARPYLIRIISCRRIHIRDINILNSPMWVQHYLACEDVNIEGITVNSRVNNNNDGIDIDGCDNVRISNCMIVSGDDAIVLKSTLDRPCNNVTITNCVISSNCNGFKLGTETNGGFQNITLSNCTIYDTRLGGISLELVDGGIMDRVTITNVTMNNVGTAVFIRLGNRARPFDDKMGKPGMGRLKNVIISNILADNVGSTGCSITGLEGYPVENITLKNIRLTFTGGGSYELVQREIPEIPEAYPEYGMFGKLPAYGFYCRHAVNLTFDDVEMDFKEADARPAMVLDDIKDLELYKINGRVFGAEPVIRCKNVRNMLLQSCMAPVGIKSFLLISGEKSDHILLSGNDLRGAEKAVILEGNIKDFADADNLK